MKRRDLDALRRCVHIASEDDARREQFARMRKLGSGWSEIAGLAATVCQFKTLRLKPWDWPPCWIMDGDAPNPRDPPDARAAATALAEKLSAAGLSRFEPDPMAALARVGAETAVRRAS